MYRFDPDLIKSRLYMSILSHFKRTTHIKMSQQNFELIFLCLFIFLINLETLLCASYVLKNGLCIFSCMFLPVNLIILRKILNLNSLFYQPSAKFF